MCLRDTHSTFRKVPNTLSSPVHSARPWPSWDWRSCFVKAFTPPPFRAWWVRSVSSAKVFKWVGTAFWNSVCSAIQAAGWEPERLADGDSQWPPPVSRPVRATFFCFLMAHSTFAQQLVPEADHMSDCEGNTCQALRWVSYRHHPISCKHIALHPSAMLRNSLAYEQSRWTTLLGAVTMEGPSVCIHLPFPTSQRVQSVPWRGSNSRARKRKSLCRRLLPEWRPDPRQRLLAPGWPRAPHEGRVGSGSNCPSGQAFISHPETCKATTLNHSSLSSVKMMDQLS